MDKAMEMMKMFMLIMNTTDSLETIMSAICSALDEWSIEHNVSMAELEAMVDRCAILMKNCHKAMGW